MTHPKTRDIMLFLKYEKAAHPEYIFPPALRNMRVIKRTSANLRRMLKRHGVKWRIITTEKSIIVEREKI